MAEDCVVVKKNLGKSKCIKLPQVIRGMISTNDDFRLTAAQAADPALAKTALQNAIKAGLASRIYKWPDFSMFEQANEDAVYEETPLTDLPVRDGKYRMRFGITKNLCIHKAMYSHRSLGGTTRAFFYDLEDNLIGTEFSDGKVGGFRLSLLNSEKLVISDGSVSTKSPVYIVLSNNKELDKSGVLLDGSYVDELFPLTDAELTVELGEDDTTLLVIVKNACDGTPVTGLIAADFNFLKDDDTAQDPDTVVEQGTGSGIYLATRAASFVSGSVDLVAASALSIDAYESEGEVEYDIV